MYTGFYFYILFLIDFVLILFQDFKTTRAVPAPLQLGAGHEAILRDSGHIVRGHYVQSPNLDQTKVISHYLDINDI